MYRHNHYFSLPLGAISYVSPLVLFAVCVFVFWKSAPLPFFLSLLTTADSSSLSSEGEWGREDQSVREC